MLRRTPSKIYLTSALMYALASFYPADVISDVSLWNGIGANNDLNDNNNWLPNDHVPTSSDVAEFNSSVFQINTSPTATNTDFSVGSIHFVNQASPFTFTFNNCRLIFNDNGITGNHTNALMSLNNIDNPSGIDSNLEMSGTDLSTGRATINILNSATLTGSETGQYISRIDSRQVDISDPLTILSGGQITVVNSGLDSTSGGGGNVVAEISYEQAYFSDTVTVGDNVVLSFSNSGVNNSTGNTSSTYVADTEEGGVYIDGEFRAGNNLNFSVSNSGNDASSGVGGNYTGYISGTAQLEFDDIFDVQDNVVITISNSGNCSSGTISADRNHTGWVSDPQLYVSDRFTAGNNLSIHLTNSGNDSSSSSVGDNRTGYINGNQLETSAPVIVADNASFVIENSGLYSGTASSSGNLVGYISDGQVYFSDTFQAGDFLSISVSNRGEDHSGNLVDGSFAGFINGRQLYFGNTCQVGNNANIAVSNTGTSSTLAVDKVGFIDGDQLTTALPFTAGKDLSIIVSNRATISGNSTEVGSVINQINFSDTCTIDDGAFISSSNLGQGTVNGSQILFAQGFDLLSGKATFKAINEGTIIGHGIEVQNGSGGNVNVILGNSSLYISSPSTDFTVGALNGDSTSSVQSQPIFTINTHSGVNASFAGSIQDYSSPSSLVKLGQGSQKLSGANTFTGDTTIEEGTLILTGSIAGKVNINTNGVLKGTGQVADDVVNFGTIAPGESIGTIHFLSNYTNNNGNYSVEVSGTGASDLIQVTSNAILNGGLIIVSSVDGTYKFQDTYTIVETSGTRSGFYTGATAISSLIQPVVTYDNQHVYLTLLTNIQHAAKTPNQLAIAKQLDGIVNPNEQQSLLLSEIVGLSNKEAREALDSLSGYQHAAGLMATQLYNRQFIRRLFDPIRTIVTTVPDCCCDPCESCDVGLSPWLEIGGTFSNIQGSYETYGLDIYGYNMTLGAQATVCRSLTFGIAGSYEYENLNFNHSHGNEKINNWLAGFYGLYRPSSFYGLVDFVYGNSSNHLTRSINVGSLHYHARSNPDIHQFTFYGEAGLDVNVCNNLLQPFIGVEVGNFRRKHVEESFANGWGLDVKKINHTLTTTRLGFHLTTNDMIQCGESLSLDVAWNYLVSHANNKVNERFQVFGNPFTIEWTKFNRNSIDYALTYSTFIFDTLQGYVEGIGESWEKGNTFAVQVGLQYFW